MYGSTFDEVKFMCYFAQILVHHISGNNGYIVILFMLANGTKSLL